MQINKPCTWFLALVLLFASQGFGLAETNAAGTPSAREASTERRDPAPAAEESLRALDQPFDPEFLERGRIRFDPLSTERPEDFWWPSPDAYLRAVYGDCGVRSCCKFCLKGKPCGDACISRAFTCRKQDPCGCACRRPLFSEVPAE